MTRDEIIRVVLAIVVGIIVFTVFKKPSNNRTSNESEARRPARLAIAVFSFGAIVALIFMAVNAEF
jgi:flagellar basal body-associated protein FliL